MLSLNYRDFSALTESCPYKIRMLGTADIPDIIAIVREAYYKHNPVVNLFKLSI